jgi:hypothetical protein
MPKSVAKKDLGQALRRGWGYCKKILNNRSKKIRQNETICPRELLLEDNLELSSPR